MHFYKQEPIFSRINGNSLRITEIRILCGDCCDVLRRVPDNCVDRIVSSTPHNFGLEYDRCCDMLSWQRYFTGLKATLNERICVLKWNGCLAFSIQPFFSG